MRPRFRSKRDRAQSIRFTKAARFRITDAGRLRLPGIGDVPVRWSRDLPSEPTSVTVTVDAAWTCGCRTTHDRDVNAARNILAAGRAESSETLVELVSAGPPIPQPAVKREPAGSTV